MKPADLYTGVMVWCGWKSRYLWFTGVVRNGEFVFRDAMDAITVVSEEGLKNLEVRKSVSSGSSWD